MGRLSFSRVLVILSAVLFAAATLTGPANAQVLPSGSEFFTRVTDATDAGFARCISCDFVVYFMQGLSAFSSATFEYFLVAFRVLAPILLLIWLGWKTAALMSLGGEDGSRYIYSLLSKLTLFFFIWSFATIGTGTPATDGSSQRFLWRTAGPEYLGYAFQMSGEVRDSLMQSTSLDGNGGVPFSCDRPRPSVQRLHTSLQTKYLDYSVKMACVVERTHFMGISIGLAIFRSMDEAAANVSWYNPFTIPPGLFDMAIRLITGIFVIFAFGLSAVWLVFLILDIAVRAFVMAAFSPVLALAGLFKPSRPHAIKAIKAAGGAILTAVGISVVSMMGVILLTNTIEVYNSMVPSMRTADNVETLLPIPTGSAIEEFSEFIKRVEEMRKDQPRIPMNPSAPWLYFLLLTGISIFAFGKKIISLLHSLIGYTEQASMANMAARAGKAVGAGAGVVATFATAKTLGMGLQGLSVGGGMGWAGLKKGGSLTARGFQSLRNGQGK